MQYAVGIDIGGTKVAIALVNEQGKIVSEDKLPTDLTIAPTEMIERIIASVNQQLDEQVLSDSDLIGIGIGAPGPLNSKEGLITSPPNLKNWRNIPIVEQFKSHFTVPIRLENDANAAALAERWLGAAQATNDFVYLTISTGIGAGIYVNGQLVTGLRGNAGDFGHTVINPSYGECVCGQHGCLEHIASGTAIARKGSQLAGKSLSTVEVIEAYQQDDPILKPFVQDVFRTIGIACVTLINTFDPEKIVLGGGVTKVGHVLFKEVEEYVKTFALNPASRATEIVPAKLDQNAGVIGAAALILQG
ncbi:glucokinase [Amphibacillus marinus]|uniref:Glucokinase n=1 Tax=Amphibacillus marinus TaxID=872970 RepID=A0A1H8MAL8_9BACI|nr:ROK family protein [Amphibacillus marinus]SEO14411.1 glucokinase [Amphibacillus marinus]